MQETFIAELEGCRGRKIKLFRNKCEIKTSVTIGSVLTANATDGSKMIYFKDVSAVQFKPRGFAIGYLQFETPGLTMNNAESNFFNENTFTFDGSLSNEFMEKIYYAAIELVECAKQGDGCSDVSITDELRKNYELLNAGILTQNEYEVVKQKILTR